jgi:glycogen debranching enzyme
VVDDWRDEEPGKLIHQTTRSPLAEAGLNNNLRNYGDYATAPDFLIMLGQYLSWTDDTATVRKLLPTARRVVEWIERYGDLDDDGLVEYRTRSPKGIKNQGWKDADDAIVDEEARIIEPPIATVELQAYVYAGLQQAAIAFAVAGGDRGYALELVRKARGLKKRINDRFWMPDRDFYAMALGPDKRPVTSISSNPAHLLACGVVPRARAVAVARRLMEPDLFSGWGIRTLSSDHPAYNPFSYHRGSVWPVENGTAAIGLARYGFRDDLHRLA